MSPINASGGLSGAEVIQQAFNPSISVLVSPDVDIICSKNRLTFVELLQPFSRLSVEGQIRDVNNSLHTLNQLRLSVRDIAWKPVSPVLAKRLLAEAASNYSTNESRITVSTLTGKSLEINSGSPWFDSWREALWSCLEMTEHDFTRHYVSTFLVVSSSHPNPMEQFQQLNDNLHQLMANSSTGEGPRWMSSMVLRYFILVHDACEGDAAKAEEYYQTLRNTYGTQLCHLLIINSKPLKSEQADPSIPAPDPWLRFLPRKSNKPESIDNDAMDSELPDRVVESNNSLTTLDLGPKLPLMDALNDAMQEITTSSGLPASESTSTLSSMSCPLSSRSEVLGDPLSDGVSNRDSWKEGEMTQSVLGETTIPHGRCLTTDDVDRIQNMINEFCLKSLLPHMERQMKLLNEAANARKSTHRSLLSATKRWFGSGRPGNQATPATLAVSYHPESAQLQVRRLGDMAFLLGLYDLAYSSYHSAKKDFEADQAWLHFAGAQEMAALSAFLQGNGRTVPYRYFDSAITAYLQTCKMANWATRCVILAGECFKATGQYSEAALHLIRLTSEDADLRSAVLLEQAALCFLSAGSKSSASPQDGPKVEYTTPLLRKYAFHMILAGHRYGKSAQKRHAARAYQQALQVYRGDGWSLAEDHIHYTVGRQCLNGQQMEAAASALAALLKADSKQTPSQQTAYLNEFIHVHQLLSKQGVGGVPHLPIPLVEGNDIKVLVETKDVASPTSVSVTEASHVTFSDDEVHHTKWSVLEEKLVLAAQGSVPMMFRPTNVLFTATTNNTSRPSTFCNELISLEVPLVNPLHIPVTLNDVRLLWEFSGGDSSGKEHVSSNCQLGANEDSPYVITYITPRLLFSPSSSQKVILHLKAKVEGLLTIVGLGFELQANSVESPATGKVPSITGQVAFNVRGPRLNSTTQERHSTVYAVDKRLQIQIGMRMPKLNVLLHDLPEFLFSGEIRPVRLQLLDVQPDIAVTDVLMACNDPTNVIVDLPRAEAVNQRATLNDAMAIYRWDPASKSTVVWLRGSQAAGLKDVDFMFYYSTSSVKSRYRILRHSSKIFVSSSLSVSTLLQYAPSAIQQPDGVYSETLSAQVEIRNLRDADDTSLSGINVTQLSLVSHQWQLETARSTVPEGILHPQESMMCSMLAQRARANQASDGELCKSATASKNCPAGKDQFIVPYGRFIEEFRKSPQTDSVVAVSWAATQAREDGFGTTTIEGQHYFGWSDQDIRSFPMSSDATNSNKQIVTYSMDYSTKVFHNFNQQRLCVIPVVLHFHNCSRKEVNIHYRANVNNGKLRSGTQLYMPEAATPLLWVGSVEGRVCMKGATEAVHLAIAVSRPGVYSLAQGLQIDATLTEKEPGATVTSSKMEFTLIVENQDV